MDCYEQYIKDAQYLSAPWIMWEYSLNGIDWFNCTNIISNLGVESVR